MEEAMNNQITVTFGERMAPHILESYFDKRAAWYQQRLNLPHRHARRDKFDDCSHIVLATDGEECVGGLRATVRWPSQVGPLPMEVLCPRLRLQDVYPDLRLESTPHAEISKLIVHSSRGPLSFHNKIAERLLEFLLLTDNPEPSVPFVFILAPRLQMRLYTAQARALGVNFETRPVPESCLIPELRAQAPIMIMACHLADSRSQLEWCEQAIRDPLQCHQTASQQCLAA
jgi:hypothetical protein